MAIIGSNTYAEDALSNTADTVMTGPGRLDRLFVLNGAAAVTFIQFFDTTGAVTVGTTVPTFFIAIPAGQAGSIAIGAKIKRGLKIAATTTATGASAPGTAQLVSAFFSKD